MPSGRVIGFGLIGLSTLLYLGLFLVPFAPLPTEGKVALASGMVVGGEASFWIGGLLLGKEFVSRYRRALSPVRWFRREEPPK
jgi:hypothetical protein